MQISLISIYTQALYSHVCEIRENGFLRQYQSKESFTSFPHGRILIGQTLERSLSNGFPNKAAITWFQRSIDIPANQCILHAVLHLARLNSSLEEGRQGEYREIATKLNYCCQVLSGISTDFALSFMRDPIVSGRQSPPSERIYYRQALDLSRSILLAQAIDPSSSIGPVPLPSLLLNMPSIFEKYLRNVLGRGMRTRHTRTEVLDGNQPAPRGGRRPSLFDGGSTFPTNPDIVLTDGDANVVGIVEVKYKLAAEELPNRGDLEQALVYGMAYASPVVVLAQPAMHGQRPGWHDLGKFCEARVAMYLFDLSDDLENQERRFVETILEQISELPAALA
jgi:5-methylcytosine-specific restriction enzyme subunit McrC